MKSSYSPQWNSSVRPSKQRKFRANAPLHKKHTFLSANLSKELHKKFNKRSLPLRKGDEVLVMRGSFKKKKAKISSVVLRYGFVTLEGLQRSKKDGAKVNVPFSPSNLQLITMATEDKKRIMANAPKQKETSKSIKEKEK